MSTQSTPSEATFTQEVFQGLILRHGIVDAAAIEDPLSYDHCQTVDKLGKLWKDIAAHVTRQVEAKTAELLETLKVAAEKSHADSNGLAKVILEKSHLTRERDTLRAQLAAAKEGMSNAATVIVNLQDQLAAKTAEVETLREACRSAMNVGEIHFGTNALARDVGAKLQSALAQTKGTQP